MKKLLLLTLFCAFMFSYGVAATPDGARPPHKTSRSVKTKKIRKYVYGYDRARKKVKYHRQGVDYYSYANRPSYLRMMGRAMNSSRTVR